MEIATDVVFSRLLDALFEGVCLVAADGAIIRWNQFAERITGFPADEVVGRCVPAVFVRPVWAQDTEGLAATAVHDCMQKGTAQSLRGILLHRSGARIHVEARIIPLETDKTPTACLQVFRVTSYRPSAFHNLRTRMDVAAIDPVTGLWNRRAIEEASLYCMSQIADFPRGLGLIHIQLETVDGRVLTDLAQPERDRLLHELGQMLRAQVYKSDLIGHSRPGEFMIILPDTSGAAAARAAHKLLDALRGCCLTRKVALDMRAGVAAYRPAESLDSWHGRADQALGRARRRAEPPVELDMA